MRFTIPAAFLLALLILLGIGLRLKPNEVPSPLVGRPVPEFVLPTLDGEAALGRADLVGRPLLVNFWASWCTPCLQEHPVLMRIARRDRVEIVGIAYKDTPEDSRAWLARHGDPFRAIALDAKGRAGLDFGVYGVPETFVIGADGSILYKQIGPMTEQDWEQKIRPLLQWGASS